VDVGYGGSVNAMAKATRIPQRSLAMAVNGEVKEPRRPLLARIIDHHARLDVTWEWLLTGQGPAPRPPALPESFKAAAQTAAAAFEWEALVLSLDPSEPVREHLLALPEQITEAAHAFGLCDEQGEFPIWFYHAQTDAFRVGITFLRGWLRQAGAAAVRQRLTRSLAAAPSKVPPETATRPKGRRPRKEKSR
jgi:hypothetical protein